MNSLQYKTFFAVTKNLKFWEVGQDKIFSAPLWWYIDKTFSKKKKKNIFCVMYAKYLVD